MSCSCTGNCDLINISNLVLSDTFHTWYDRTNEIIDAINPLQIYDVNVGQTDGGLTLNSTCVNGDTNGVITLKVWPGPGIGVGTTLTPNYYLNHTMIDVSNMLTLGETGFSDAIVANRSLTSFPNNNDWFIVSDTLDNRLGSGAGTPKRISAQHILPPTVYLPPGFQFNGNVSINGNFSVQGTASNIDSNDLRIEDKVIEIAYHRLVTIDVTGPTYGGFPAQGAKFHYYDPGVTNVNDYTTVGEISQVNFYPTYTTLKLHNFTFGGVNDIVAGGRISITGTALDFSMIAGPTTTENFYGDIELDEAGIRVRGSDSDKHFIWVYEQGPYEEVVNTFMADTNLGVSGTDNHIYSSRFKSFGYFDPDVMAYKDDYNNKFHFIGHEGADTSIRLGGLGTAGSPDSTYGFWALTRYNYGSTGSQQPLVFSFKQSSNHGETDKFTIWSSASGPSYPYITGPTGQGNNVTTNFAQRLNVDLLDGAHGTTMPTPFSIPVARASGTIDPGWIDFDNSSIGKCYSVTAHSFVIGDVVRLDPDNLSITGAIATSPENAEVLGIVNRVVDADNFCVTTKGYISGLTGTASSRIASILPLSPGNAYFLSADNVRGMIADPDGGASQLQLGEIRKPLIVALGPDSAYVHNYLGAVFGGIASGGGAGATGTLSDVVDIQGLMPVGIIQPFSGELEYIPSGWLLCDGRRLEKSLWTELHTAIGQKFYADGTLNSSYNPIAGGNVPIDIAGWNRGLQINDAVTVEATVNGVLRQSDTFVTAVSGTTVSFDETTFAYGDTFGGATSFRIRGRLKTPSESYTSVFFIPDLRRRILVGATKGLTGALTPSISVGDIGGTNQVTLSSANIPPHEHRLNSISVNTGLDTQIGVGFAIQTPDSTSNTFYTARGPLGVSTATPFDNMQEYVTVHWIIRAQKGLSAIILTGHNHDDRYVRYDQSQTVTSSQRSTFRTNAHVLSDGFDGGATFTNRLTITGGAVIGDDGSSLLVVRSGASFGGGATFNSVGILRYPFSGASLTHQGMIGVDDVSNYTRWAVRGNPYSQASNGYGDLLVENGWTGSPWNTISGSIPLMQTAAVKVRGGTISTASIAIFNDNALGSTNDTCSVLMYGKGTASDDATEVRFSGGIRGKIDRGEDTSTITRKFSVVLGGGSTPNGAEDVLTFTRKQSTPATVDINIPKGLATISSPSSYVVLDSNNNLKKVTTVTSVANIPISSNTLTGSASFDTRHFQVGGTGHVVSKITVNGQSPDNNGNITVAIPTASTYGVKAHGSYDPVNETTFVSANLSFSLPAGVGLSTVRCQFITQMPNTNYSVIVTPIRPSNWGAGQQIENRAMGVKQGTKTVTHFDLVADYPFGGAVPFEVVVVG